MLKSRFEHVSPADYDSAAVLVREVGDQVLKRLELVALSPKRILEVGSGTGYGTQQLQKRYPAAEIVAVEDSANLLAYAKEFGPSQTHWTYAPFDALPLEDHSIDLVVANLVLPWCADIKKVMREWCRVLRPEGLLMFSSYGPETLSELQSQVALPHFMDMHDLGDLLLQVGFADPVMDVDYFMLTYKEQEKLQKELQMTGFISPDVEMCNLEQNSDGVIPLTYEVVYGHAWRPEKNQAVPAENGVVKFPLAHLRGRS